MELIVIILLGAAVGWLASTIAEGPHAPVVPHVLLGIVGAFGGNWLADVLGLALSGTPARWLIALVAAVVLIGVVRALGGLRRPVRSA